MASSSSAESVTVSAAATSAVAVAGDDDNDGNDAIMTTTAPPSTTTTSSLICAIGGSNGSSGLSDDDIQSTIYKFLDQVGGDQYDDIFLLPPDFTRYHSMSGKITTMIAEYYKFINNNNDISKKEQTEEANNDDGTTTTTKNLEKKKKKVLQIMPALGTHKPMTQSEIKTMFGSELASLTNPNPWIVHDWRNDVVTIGYAPSDMVNKATNGLVNKPWPAQLNKKVWEKRHNKDRSIVLSIGQVVPHEVMGMANFNKNLFVGVGGLEAINLSHYIGATIGMENMMGKSSNPLREILNYSSEKFLQNELNLWYILTVIGPATATTADSSESESSSTSSTQPKLEMKGLFIGNDIQCYNKACELSLKENFTMLEKPPSKIVVYLDPSEFHSTWLGNKSIYRTRMAIADGGELIVLAPGIDRFGEDDEVDKLIRKFGYKGTPTIMKHMEEEDNKEELQDNLGAVAHLIHGSTEGRFNVTYCCKYLSPKEIEGVGYNYMNYDDVVPSIYNPMKLKDGWQKQKGKATTSSSGDGEEDFFYISNPALGLWAVKSRFKDDNDVIGGGDDDDDDNEKEQNETKKPRLS